MSKQTMPEWVPDDYDPDAPLPERLRIMKDIEGGIELHVQDERGIEEIVGEPQHFGENERELYLACGHSPDDWQWEIRVPKKGELGPYLERVDPKQELRIVQSTKKHWLNDIDVRIFGVDVDMLEDK